MLYIKKHGFALINTIIIISIITTLASLMFMLSQNNRKIAEVSYVDDDIFSLDLKEEDAIYSFMMMLNEKIDSKGESVEDEQNNDGNEGSYLFDNNFKEFIKGSELKYNKNEDKLIIKVFENDDKLRVRELKYKIKDNKLILVPTPNFIDTNNESDEFG
ncbi:hypothetical protein [uncultured Clostridium sp.]|uniref:hypothetical protein n=1 Tax=uncultured Clostridium sp. TaxID=59620 RepID=UPI0025D6DAD4|nr:hypothetical protein [uncultured Clostridium sp.]